jgi:hypothetical protein
MTDPVLIGTWLGVLVAIGGAIAGAAKFLFWVFDEWQKRKNHEGFVVPSATLQLTELPEGNCWWSMGKKGDEPVMQVVGKIFVTNIAPIPVRIPRVEIRYGFLGRKRIAGVVMVSRQLNENMYGMYDIGPNETRKVSFDFWVYPPVASLSETFSPRSVIFFDQFGNRHSVKRIAFSSRAPKKDVSPKEPEEYLYAITDPIEQQVVSVLKAELRRYKVCGRQVGGLGSIHIIYRGQPMTGVGGDSWTTNSPANHLLAPDPEAASLASDNLDALTKLYESFTTDEERERFVKALIDRLEAGKGYLAVSYFIVCVLWKVGFLVQALAKARQDLPEGEAKVFGFSNVLMLFNGLLRYRHPDFADSMLDELERFTHGLNEHTFFIPEKVAAIRATRLGSQRE